MIRAALGGEPANYFGSSGGAVVGLALVTAHPDQIRTLVAHEPPVLELLPDRDQVRAQVDDIYETFRADGADNAMQKFMTFDSAMRSGSRRLGRRGSPLLSR